MAIGSVEVTSIVASTRGYPGRRVLPWGLAWLSVFLLFVVSCSGSGTSGTGMSQEEEAESATDQPNIIFDLTDDLDLASVEKMPEIGSLVRDEGASFENAFVSFPVCCPSRATILTGVYAHNSGVKGNSPPSGGF
jgi:hypothetical protein